MKVKEENTKAELWLNIKKMEIMSTKELHNFNTGKVEAEMVKSKWTLQSIDRKKTET